MVFTTLKFIVFMTLLFLLYYGICKNKQWQLLLVASYIFYGFASPVYIFFLLFTTAVTYYAAILIDKTKKKKYLVVAIVILLLMLCVLKYSTFLLGNISWIFGIDKSSIAIKLILPVGLSFYMFQSMGYMIDVYREMVPVNKNFFKYALFVSYFPQILQGPIGDYSSLSVQLYEKHEFDYKKSVFGLQRIAWGFFKKLVIANQISIMVDPIWASVSANGFLPWAMLGITYAFQLYADFSGYMDIAIGCSEMLGISIAENFETPYLSKNIPEYWRKWHITLGAWFRNYVFYSILRGSLCTKIRKKYRKSNVYLSNTLPTVLSLLIVWTLIGIWHGADWGYIIHGLYHGFFVIMATVLAPVYNKLHTKFPNLKNNNAFILFQFIRTFVIVCIGYLIFKPGNINVTKIVFASMTTGLNIKEVYFFIVDNFRTLISVSLGLILLIIIDIIKYKNNNISIRCEIAKLSKFKRNIIYVLFLLLILCLGAYGSDSVNQFAYFKF